jgi:hypothetical protein
MALDTYDNLVKEIQDWSHRNDLGTKIPDFITLAENAMYSNDVQNLTIRVMEIISTAPTDGKYLSLPDDFESIRSLRLELDNGNGEVRYQAPEAMRRHPYTGQPKFFTILGGQVEFDRTPDNEYTIEIQYFRRPTNLDEGNQTNEVLANHPKIYLFGALSELHSYSQDEQQQALYERKFINAIRGANKADKKGRYGPAPSMNIDLGMTP